MSRRFGSPLRTLARRFEYNDETLSPFYDEIFAREDLDLLTPGEHGLSTLELVRKWRVKREDLLGRIEAYLTCRGRLPHNAVDGSG